MELVTAEFVKSIDRTETTKSFVFKPEKILDFIAGQFLQVIFDGDNLKNRELNKFLSFSTAPCNENFEITTRISNSDFSKKLLGLKSGDKVLFKAPMGNCVFDINEKKIAFIVGGIGITPVMSILDHIFTNNISSADIAMLYSNRSTDDIAFKNNLDNWNKQNGNFKLTYCVDQEPINDKTILLGFINDDKIIKTIPDYKKRIVFIYGPPAMVSSIKQCCLEIECEQSKIKAENFSGY